MDARGRAAQANRQVVNNRGGFTLAELLVATLVLVMAVGGILISYLRCLELNEVSRNTAIAVKSAVSTMEQINGTTFNLVKSTYHLQTFTVTGLPNSRGVIYVDDNDPNNLGVRVAVSWRQRSGRVFGEDKNLNGVVDTGEDANSDGMLDSPVMLVTMLFRR